MSSGSRGALVDGLPANRGALARVRRRAQRIAVSRAEHEEADLERKLRAHPGVTRANVVAVMSQAGGVGKTTAAFVLGNLLVTHLKLRAVVVDAGPGPGTLDQLVPARRRSEHGIVALLADVERLYTAAELRPYVSRLQTGLHVLAGRYDVRLEVDECGELLALLSCFYEVVVLDLGAGLTRPLAAMAARRADQIVLVTTADRTTSCTDKAIVAINRADRNERPDMTVAIPHDEQLQAMLATATYSLGALAPPTRTAIKRLGLVVAERLV